MMAESVTHKAVSSIFWTTIDRLGALSIQFLVTMVLARVLSPSDFGLVGMLSLFMAIGSLLVESGFSHSLIQKENISNDDYSTVFTLNICIGLVLYGIFFLSAPCIASFFGEPQLRDLSRVVFLMFPINSLYVVHLAKLTRELRFRIIARISILSALVSGTTGICIVWAGYGIWALVFQQLSLYMSRMVLYWIATRWKPSTFFSWSSFHSLWRFGMNLLYTGLITTTFDNIYVFLVGKFFSLRTTGFFNQAWQLGTMLPSLITGVVSKAMFPIFCQVHQDKLKETVRQTLTMNLFISIPVMFAVLVIASNMFTVFYSEKWLPSVPLFQILCIYGAFMPIRVVNTDAIKSQGNSKLYLHLEMLQRILVVASIILTVRQGVEVLLWGRTVACIIALCLDMYLCGRYTGYSIGEQLKDQWKTVVSSLLMMGVVYTVGFALLPSLVTLCLQTIVGGITYLALNYLLKSEITNKLIVKWKEKNFYI